MCTWKLISSDFFSDLLRFWWRRWRGVIGRERKSTVVIIMLKSTRPPLNPLGRVVSWACSVVMRGWISRRLALGIMGFLTWAVAPTTQIDLQLPILGVSSFVLIIGWSSLSLSLSPCTYRGTCKILITCFQSYFIFLSSSFESIHNFNLSVFCT